MPSTYTVNLGIEKPATGEQSGTWGDTTNLNFDIIDQAINGAVSLTLGSAGTSGSPNTLAISDGATSDGRNKWIEFTDGGDLGATAYVQLTPNDAEKIVFIRNSLSGSRSVILFQGTYDAGRDLEVPAGVDMVVKFSGGGATATTTDVFTRLRATAIETPSLTATTADINGGTVDGATIGGATPAAGTFTNLTANTNLTINATTTVDGVIDDDTMATASATKLATSESIKAYVDTTAAAQNELSEVLANGNTTGANNIIVDNGQAITTNTINETTAGSGVTIDSVLLKDDGVNATNLEITNIKANDGTAAGSIANSTGAVTITSFISNSVDIGGGAIDDVVIGGSTPAAISGTTGTFSGNLTVDTNTLFVDASNNRVGVGTATPATPVEILGNNQALAENTTLRFTDADGATQTDQLFGKIEFNSADSDAASPNRAYILSAAENSLAPSYIAFGTAPNTSAALERTRISSTGLLTNQIGATFNESGADSDFRVESDTNTHMLFVDAGNNRVGVGTSNPDAALGIADNFATVNKLLDLNSSGGLSGGVTGPVYGLYANIKANNSASDSYGGYFQATSGASDHIYGLYGRAFDQGSSNRGAVGVFGTAEVTSAASGQDPFGVDAVAGVFAKVEATGTSDNSITTALSADNVSTYGDTNYGAVIRSQVPDNAVNTNSVPLRVFYGSNILLDVLGSTTTGLSETAINQAGIDHDFRVESDTNTHALFVDAGNSRVGVNVTSPSFPFHAKGPQNTTVFALEDGSEADYRYLKITASTNGQYWDINSQGTSGGLGGRLTLSSRGVNKLTIAETEAVFNDPSADYDFRVESNNNSAMLFVDGGNDRVGIGTSSPSGMLTVGNDNATRAYSDRVRTEWNSIFGVTENTHYQRFKLTADAGRISAYVKVTIQPRSTGGISSMNGATLEGCIWRADGGAAFDLTLINNAAWGGGGVGLSEPVASGNDIIFGIVVGNNGTGSTYDVACKVELIGNTDDSFTYSEIAGTTAATGTDPGQGHYFYYNSSQLFGMDSGSTVVNEASADRDFRVESDTNTHALFVDAGLSVVNVNSTAPVVSWTSNRRMDVSINTSNSTYPGYAAYAHTATPVAGGMVVLGRSRSTTGGVAVETLANDGLGFLSFEGVNASNSFVSGAYISAVQDGAAGATGVPGSLRFFTGTAGAVPVQRLSISSGGSLTHTSSDGQAVVFNDNSGDTDFRVESNDNTHALFVDAGNDVVGMGISNPESYYANNLVVQSGSEGGITISSTNTTNSNYFMFADASSGNGRFAGYIQYSHSTDTMILATAEAPRIHLDAVEVTVNESGDSTDFRVESDSNTHALFVDAGTNSVVAGTSASLGGRIEAQRLGFSTSGNNNWKKGAFVGKGDFGGAISLVNDGGASDGFAFYLTGSPSVLNLQFGANGGTMSAGVQLSSTATAWAAYSDSRLKTITSEISGAVSSVNSLRAVNYTLNSDDANTPRVGLIAQEVQAVLPEAVDVIDEDGHLGLRYTEVIPLLVAAIKEQQATIETLEARIAALETA